MEKILDREIKIEKTNSWITITVSNLAIILIACIIIVTNVIFVKDAVILFTVLIIGVMAVILLNGTMALNLYFSSSPDWKKWGLVLALILTMIFLTFLYLYLVATSW